MTIEARAAFERAQREEPTRQISVIVTLHDWAERDAVKALGLMVSHEAEFGKMLTGTLTAATSRAVATSDAVALLELDGEYSIARRQL